MDSKATFLPFFDNAEDAKRAALTLATQQAGTLAGGVVGPALAPSPSEMEFLGQHISSLELKGDAALGVSGMFNKVGNQSTGASASLDMQSGYRVDFANGKPTDVVNHPGHIGRKRRTLPAWPCRVSPRNSGSRNPTRASWRVVPPREDHRGDQGATGQQQGG